LRVLGRALAEYPPKIYTLDEEGKRLNFSLISLKGLPDAIKSLQSLLTEHGILLLGALLIWRLGPYLVTWLRRL